MLTAEPPLKPNHPEPEEDSSEGNKKYVARLMHGHFTTKVALTASENKRISESSSPGGHVHRSTYNMLVMAPRMNLTVE